MRTFAANTSFRLDNEAAPLKLLDRIDELVQLAAFRLDNEAAPLKPTFAGASLTGLSAFRLDNEAAPLKQQDAHVRRREVRHIPPRQRGGPVRDSGR